MSATLIEAALADIGHRLPSVQLWRDYDNGHHRLAVTSPQMESAFARMLVGIRDNLCPLIIDTTVDKLHVTKFAATDPRWEAAAAAAWDWWQDQRLDARAPDAFRNAAVDDMAAFVVWPDENGVVRANLKKADQISWVESADRPGELLSAVLIWRSDAGKWSATVLTPDEGQLWESDATDATNTTWNIPGEHQNQHARQMLPLAGSFKLIRDWPNPSGQVPVFPLGPDMAELNEVIPIQDLLNKSIVNSVVGSEFYAFPKLVGIGIQPLYDDDGKAMPPTKPGPGRMWAIPANPADVAIMQLPAQDPTPFIAEQDNWRREAARVSRTPAYVVESTGGYPTGEALKTASQPFTGKVRARQRRYGPALADMAAYAVAFQAFQGSDAWPDEQPEFETLWASPEPSSTQEVAQTVATMVAAGVPLETALVMYGGWDTETAAAAGKAAAAAQASARTAALSMFDAGRPTQE